MVLSAASSDYCGCILLDFDSSQQSKQSELSRKTVFTRLSHDLMFNKTAHGPRGAVFLGDVVGESHFFIAKLGQNR